MRWISQCRCLGGFGWQWWSPHIVDRLSRRKEIVEQLHSPIEPEEHFCQTSLRILSKESDCNQIWLISYEASYLSSEYPPDTEWSIGLPMLAQQIAANRISLIAYESRWRFHLKSNQKQTTQNRTREMVEKVFRKKCSLNTVQRSRKTLVLKSSFSFQIKTKIKQPVESTSQVSGLMKLIFCNEKCSVSEFRTVRLCKSLYKRFRVCYLNKYNLQQNAPNAVSVLIAPMMYRSQWNPPVPTENRGGSPQKRRVCH